MGKYSGRENEICGKESGTDEIEMDGDGTLRINL